MSAQAAKTKTYVLSHCAIQPAGSLGSVGSVGPESGETGGIGGVGTAMAARPRRDAGWSEGMQCEGQRAWREPGDAGGGERGKERSSRPRRAAAI